MLFRSFWKFGTAGAAVKGTEGEESGFGGKVRASVKEVSISMASGEERACSGYITEEASENFDLAF